MVDLFVVFFLLFAFEAKASWKFWGEKEESCEGMVDPIINKPLTLTILTKSSEDIDYIKKKCYQLILKDGNHKELYAYYKLYEYTDKALKQARKGQDETPNNIYHYMLFYANQNSREFDPKTNSFKKERGLYEQELKSFEDSATQEEKIKAFSYIADNLATGTEGWVKINDYKKSFEYLKKAAEAGDVKSQAYLGYSYFTGLDWMKKIQVEKNYIQCYKWLRLSTLHSEQQSYVRDETLDALKTMTMNMTPQQLQQARQQAQIWLDQNKEFIKNHPLKIIPIAREKITSEKAKTKKFIKDYELGKSFSNNSIK